MKKLMYLMVGIVLAVAMTSCEKEKVNKNGDLIGNDAVVKAQPVTVTGPSAPQIVLDDVPYTPYVIPGTNRGGNRTCEEAQAAFDIMALDDESEFYNMSLGDFTDCGEKIDIDDDYVGEVEGFPFYVEVNDDGSIYFNTGDKECQVKIVIVKGSNEANVYYFPEGVSTADGLASPAFEDGRIPWVSNLTFCCFCEDVPEEKVIAMKVWYKDADGGTHWAPSVADEEFGTYPYDAGWCASLGVNDYFGVSPIAIGSVGEAVVAEGSVDVTLGTDLEITSVSIYVGLESDLPADCPDYLAAPWMVFSGDGDNTLTCTF